MTPWDERFKDHDLWLTIQAPVRDGNEPLTTEMLLPLKAVQVSIGRRLPGVDRYLLIAGPLDVINSFLATLMTEVGNFVANGNRKRLTKAGCLCD
jgi:hypothetical protein